MCKCEKMFPSHFSINMTEKPPRDDVQRPFLHLDHYHFLLLYLGFVHFSSETVAFPRPPPSLSSYFFHPPATSFLLSHKCFILTPPLTPLHICAGAAFPAACRIALLPVLAPGSANGLPSLGSASKHGTWLRRRLPGSAEVMEGMLRTCPGRLDLLLQFSDRFAGPSGPEAPASQAHLRLQAEPQRDRLSLKCC